MDSGQYYEHNVCSFLAAVELNFHLLNNVVGPSIVINLFFWKTLVTPRFESSKKYKGGSRNHFRRSAGTAMQFVLLQYFSLPERCCKISGFEPLPVEWFRHPRSRLSV